MFYKFVGGEEPDLIEILDKAAIDGSLKFTPALAFNDPFEFKFNAITPTREAYDEWHRIHDPHRPTDELEHAWSSFSGGGADWSTNFVPRQNLLHQLYVLCLARRWDSHLMWAHYARDHNGYTLVYLPEIVSAVESFADYAASGDVAYRTHLPDVRWFQVPREEMVGPVLFSKSAEWAYEAEFRIILAGPPDQTAVYARIAPALVAGVILGTRVSNAVVAKAMAIRERRSEFFVRKIGSTSRSYELDTFEVDGRSWRYGHML